MHINKEINKITMHNKNKKLMAGVGRVSPKSLNRIYSFGSLFTPLNIFNRGLKMSMGITAGRTKPEMKDK